ncbi:hypothetical protein QVD17_18078 [Tagetes erecta]|uniref:Uncharacterized protein n=1 Tax=Tagetes erecta TaxID=13708 RepID=A0AAD8NW14_TARER|nr:hypothetical protein QVD17_18078 [Tagetes erecta]
MWKLKIAEGNDPYLFTTNNFVGRQFWEFDPDAGTPEERQEVENARQNFQERKKKGFRTTSDLLMRLQDVRDTGVPPSRLHTFPTFSNLLKMMTRFHKEKDPNLTDESLVAPSRNRTPRIE